MDDTLIGFVIFIGEENRPIRRQGRCVDSKPVVLCCDEAPPSRGVGTRLIVTTVTIPGQDVCVNVYHNE